MALNKKELIKLLTVLKKDFGDNVDEIIENISKENITWLNDCNCISFFENNSKSIFNANHLFIFSKNKKLPECISTIKISKDKKNAIFVDIYGNKKIIPYNKDIFVGVKQAPLDDFLNQM